MNVDWAAVRAEFPALARWTYLNTATFGQMPRRAVAAIEAHLARRDELACADFMSWFDDADAIRALAARLVHCRPEDIAFVPNACSAFSLLIGGIDWRPGDRIVTLRDEFPNHYYFPCSLQPRGVEFVESDFACLTQAVTPGTRVVALSTVNYSTGLRPPLEELSAFLRERGVLLYVDGTQSLGALQFDLRSVPADMFAVHGYKWLLAPTGAGFMYVSPELRERLAPGVMGWRSDCNWRRPEDLRHGAPELTAAAERYEGGMLAFPVLYAMGASLEMMLEIGPERIERRVMELAEATRSVLRAAGGELLSDRLPHHDSPVVAARFPGRDAGALARELKARNVLVSARHGNLRVSPHFYNDETDLERLAAALGGVL